MCHCYFRFPEIVFSFARSSLSYRHVNLAKLIYLFITGVEGMKPLTDQPSNQIPGY